MTQGHAAGGGSVDRLAERVTRAATLMIVYWSGWLTGWKLYVVVMLGFVLLAIFKAFGGVRQGAFHFWQGFSWLFPWLDGLALISYPGNFPEKSAGAGNLCLLNFEWSALILAVLSVVVYVIANRVCLSTEIVQEHIEQSRQEAAVEEEEIGAARDPGLRRPGLNAGRPLRRPPRHDWSHEPRA